jgi:cytochrome P450
MTDTAEATAPLDPLGDAYHRDPHGETARVRATQPLHRVEAYGVWIATSHALVRRLLNDPVVTNDPITWEGYEPPAPGSVQEWLFGGSLFSMDPPAHARTRRLVSRALTPAAVARMEAQVADVVDEHAERLRGRTGVVDLTEYTLPIPNTVISRITGVPPLSGDEARFRELAGGAIRGVDPFLDDEARAESEGQLAELTGYLRELVDQRRAEPRDDLVTDLVRAYDADDHLTNDEVVMIVVALVLAGSETTSHASTFALHSLLTHPDQLARLRADPSRCRAAVDELLRFELGGGLLPRFAAEDFEVDGQVVTKGQIVFLSMLGAHRDPDVFPDPDRLDLDRDTSQVLAFGRGPHHCLGAHLARTEMALIVGRALEVLPAGTVLVEEQVRLSPPSFIFRRLEHLPVDVGPG